MAFRKRRVATPGFGHTPWNPIQGGHANLRQEGTFPYCAMMQVAAEDTYDDYVICRGFDPRILKFIDYEGGNADKPGISVAKPFGNRVVGRYHIAEVYPALLPTQGNAGFADFRQVVYMPPSPIDVDWRVGQNPGVVSGGLAGGQPSSLGDNIEILRDHNDKVINWLLLDSQPKGSLITVKTLSSCAARSDSTGTMSSVSCSRYITATDGTETYAGYDITVFNPGGNIDADKWAEVELNEAGMYVFVVVKCHTP